MSSDARQQLELPTRGAAPAVLAKALQRWFAAGHRDLPWRRTRDPYAIWVSEVMLQQTRVETVERYWSEFLRRFPTAGALAAADETAVLQAWSGLGYYRRARLLHRGARHLAEARDGALPDEHAELLKVPGIGRYTAGALTTIAFDRPAPIVDGNVARVLSRLDGVSDPKEQPATAARHWPRAEAIVSAGQPRLVAQALMELGATVCTPKNPACDRCPVAAQCVARATDRQHDIPAPKQRKASPTMQWWALAIRWRGKLGLVRRPDEGLLAGLWCLPLVPRAELATPTAAALSEHLGVPIERVTTPAEAVVHVFTHRVWHLQPVVVTARRRPSSLPGGVAHWAAPGERPEGGIPSVTEKLLAVI